MEEWRRKKIEQVYTKWEKRERHGTHRADPTRYKMLVVLKTELFQCFTMALYH